MISVPLTFSLAPLPTGLALTADAYAQQIVSNLQASFSGNFLTGQTLGPMPSTDIGPWFDGTQWWAFNPAQNQYTPLKSQSSSANVLDNGSMMVWQRNTTFNNPANGAYLADRYLNLKNMTVGTVNFTRANAIAVTGYPYRPYAMRATSQGVQSVISGAEFSGISQKVERQMSHQVFNTVTSLTVVLRSSIVGTFCVSIRNAGQTQSYVHECKIIAANVPQAFLIENIPAMPTATGNWGVLDTDAAYSVTITLACGSSFFATPDVWSSGNFLGTSNQANLFNTTASYLEVSMIQHEPGPVANTFHNVPFDQDLRRCQRYYALSYDYGFFPGQVTFQTAIVFMNLNPGTCVGYVRYPQPLRVPPTSLHVYSPQTGAIDQVYDGSGADRPVSNIGVTAANGFFNIAANPLTNGSISYFQYAASADL